MKINHEISRKNHRVLIPSLLNGLHPIISEMTIGLGRPTSCTSNLEINQLTIPWKIQVLELVVFSFRLYLISWDKIKDMTGYSQRRSKKILIISNPQEFQIQILVYFLLHSLLTYTDKAESKEKSKMLQ